MKVELITLLKDLQPVEAHILKGKLDSAGIPCFVFDENLTTFYPFAGGLTGGVKLKVRPEDEARAKEILNGDAEMKVVE